MKFFRIDVPVRVGDEGSDKLMVLRSLTVRITMGDAATVDDAVQELARKLEATCNTIDIGDCT